MLCADDIHKRKIQVPDAAGPRHLAVGAGHANRWRDPRSHAWRPRPWPGNARAGGAAVSIETDPPPGLRQRAVFNARAMAAIPGMLHQRGAILKRTRSGVQSAEPWSHDQFGSCDADLTQRVRTARARSMMERIPSSSL